MSKSAAISTNQMFCLRFGFETDFMAVLSKAWAIVGKLRRSLVNNGHILSHLFPPPSVMFQLKDFKYKITKYMCLKTIFSHFEYFLQHTNLQQTKINISFFLFMESYLKYSFQAFINYTFQKHLQDPLKVKTKKQRLPRDYKKNFCPLISFLIEYFVHLLPLCFGLRCISIYLPRHLFTFTAISTLQCNASCWHLSSKWFLPPSCKIHPLSVGILSV